MFDLTGKTAIVTGATKGIGRGIADGLAQAGANVVVVSRHYGDCADVAQDVMQRYGVGTLPVACDILQRDQVTNLLNLTVDAFGRVDILVNNAGTAITKKAEDLLEEDWDRVVNLDLKACFFCAQTVGQQMIRQQRGKIINIASILGLVADKQILPYAAAKGGVVQFTKALALEWAKHNIQVNAVCPGYIMTDINRAELESEKIAKHLLGKIAARRFGTAEDIAGAAVYLASEASNYMTGHAMVIDGGWCAE